MGMPCANTVLDPRLTFAPCPTQNGPFLIVCGFNGSPRRATRFPFIKTIDGLATTGAMVVQAWPVFAKCLSLHTAGMPIFMAVKTVGVIDVYDCLSRRSRSLIRMLVSNCVNGVANISLA